MSINFDLADLQAFAALAERGSFHRAAESIHISQPALSRRIEKLENALGVRLFDRSTRRVNLTAVGRDFARKVRLILDDLDQTLLGIREVAATRVGEVTIACVPSAVYFFLPQVISRYHERYPRIKVKVIDDGANEVLSAVVNGEVDFGINYIGREEPDIEFLSFHEDRFVVACRKDHPLAKMPAVRWAELGPHDFVSFSKRSGNRLLIDLALANTEGRPQSRHEVVNVTTLIGLVEAGLGVGAVPSLAMPAYDHPTLCSVDLIEPVVKRHLGLITRKGRSLSPAADQMFKLLVELGPRYREQASQEPEAR